MNQHNEHSRSIALIKLLIGDVIAARLRLDSADTPTARRDTIRSSLAAMEGMTWPAREHVRGTLDDLAKLTPVADLAFREHSYTVSDVGKLVVQLRSMPLPTAIRFIVAQAQIICPEFAIDFAASGWSDLKKSIIIRNRITHPKPESDLDVSNDDLDRVASGLSWLAATVTDVMASTNLALVRHSDAVKDLYERLRAGEPEALADYNAALSRSDDATD